MDKSKPFLRCQPTRAFYSLLKQVEARYDFFPARSKMQEPWIGQRQELENKLSAKHVRINIFFS